MDDICQILYINTYDGCIALKQTDCYILGNPIFIAPPKDINSEISAYNSGLLQNMIFIGVKNIRYQMAVKI